VGDADLLRHVPAVTPARLGGVSMPRGGRPLFSLLVLVPRFDPMTLSAGSYLYAEQLSAKMQAGKSLRRP